MQIGRPWAGTIIMSHPALVIMIAAAQVTEIVMPEVGGTDAEQAAIWQVLNRYKHVFGPPPVGGSKLRPMSIELKPGVSIPKPAPARRVSPDILADIRADTHRAADSKWLDEKGCGR